LARRQARPHSRSRPARGSSPPRRSSASTNHASARGTAFSGVAGAVARPHVGPPCQRPGVRWVLGEAAGQTGEEAADRLAAALGVLPVVGRALWARGLRSAEDAGRFLQPALADLFDPFLMKGATVAVDRLQRALREREPICIYGDYDVDGVTST